MCEQKWYQHTARTITIYVIKHMIESGNDVQANVEHQSCNMSNNMCERKWYQHATGKIMMQQEQLRYTKV
ncbi:11255_t:CDS:1, partial [Scutellospora calospora]